MAKANRKKSKFLTPYEIQQLQADFRNGMSKEKIVKKYGISMGGYYKHVKPERERMMKRLNNTDIDMTDGGSTTDINVNVSAVEANVIDGIPYSDLTVRSQNYLKGMALTFGVTEAEILDDLVNLALDLGAMELHGKK